MVDVRVSKVLQAFSSAFRSIDLRTVAVDYEGQLTNVITSMFFSYKLPEEVELEQQKLGETLPSSGDFYILLRCLPFKRAPNLFRQLEKGKLDFDLLPIRFGELNITKLGVYQSRPDFLKETGEWRLIGSKADAKKDDGIWNIVDNQNGKARLYGYRDTYDLINEILGIKGYSRGRSEALIIGIPILARIVNVHFVDSSLKIKTKKAAFLEDLQLNVYHERPSTKSGYYEFVGQSRKPIPVSRCKSSSKRHFCTVTNSLNLASAKPYDQIEVELIHKQEPSLSMDKFRLRVPLVNVAEPLSKALSSFCTIDEFRERLLFPERYRNSSTVFENAVAWLLSLVGLPVVQLGKEFEKLRVHETKFEKGSIDMIAYKENEYLLLIDCDTSIPDDKKIKSMIVIKEFFESIQSIQGEPRICPIIISPRNCSGLAADTRNIVKIVDGFAIEQIFEEVMKGNIEQAIYSLIY